jgi:hypothetical protein
MTRTESDPTLKQAVAIGTPVEVVDTTTNEVYYLISAEQFQRIVASLSGDIDPREVYPLIDKAMAEDDVADRLVDSYH